MSSKLPAVIVLSHGSPRSESVIPIMQSLCQRLRRYLAPEVVVAWAAMQFNHPTLVEAAENLIGIGARKIVVMPYFLYSGQHVTHDIPEIIAGIRQKHPDVTITMTGTLDRAESLIELVAERLGAAVPELMPRFDDSATAARPEEIETLSMRLISENMPELNFNDEEMAVVRRMVHASGDLTLGSLVEMMPDAVAVGRAALRKGAPVITDVRMVAAGISRLNADKFGVDVICALDQEGLAQEARATGQTRSAVAVKKLGEKLNGAVVAVGNAPTALYALLELIDAGKVSPALVVGMPVGFVQARESKEALTRRDVPYITVRGTRGGSNLAAAVVNALLKLNAEESSVS